MIKSLKKIIPSIITMLNLLSGCLAILLSFYDLALAGLLIIAAGIFDFADGLAARMLDAYSDFGKELDSLADIVSFGVAPSFILFQLLSMALIGINPYFSENIFSGSSLLILSISFLPAVFAAIRLARFNVEPGGNDIFRGLPSPAAGLFIAAAGFIYSTTESFRIMALLNDIVMLSASAIVISLLMVIPIPMFSIKFKNFSLTGNLVRYIFLLPSFLLFIYMGISSIILIIAWYVILSAIVAIIPGRETG